MSSTRLYETGATSRAQMSPEAISEMRAAIKAYIEDLPRQPKITVSSAPKVGPCQHFKQVYRSKGKGRGKRVKTVR